MLALKSHGLGTTQVGSSLKRDRLEGAIEVKFPYSKGDMTLQEANESDKGLFLSVDENKLALRKRHAYYYQCQGVLIIVEVDWLDFVAYTT